MALYGTFYNISGISAQEYLHLYRSNRSVSVFLFDNHIFCIKEIHAIEKKLETDPEWMYLNTIDLNKMFETTRPIYVRPV